MRRPHVSLLILLAACSSQSPLSTGTIRGRVVDAAAPGHPGIAGATVRTGDLVVSADADGRFELRGVPSGTVSVYAESPVTTTGHRRVESAGGVDLDLTLYVLPTQITRLDDAAVGGRVEPGDGLVIDFPPGVVVDEAGSPVTGEVTIRYALLDDPIDFAAAPGEMQAAVGGKLVQLTSGGMLFAELSQDEVALNLGAPVDLRFPAAAGIADAPGYLLYSMDETAGAWVEEGVAERLGGEIVARVPHFSFWNYDLVISWQGCVEASLAALDGTPVGQSSTTAATWTDVGVWVTGGAHTNLTPDASGAVAFPGPGGESVAFSFISTSYAADGTATDHYWTTGPRSVPDPADGCLDLGVLVETGNDGDGDLYAAVPWGEDCDDGNEDVGPDEDETWNDSVDDNCDGNWCDADLDGWCHPDAIYVPPGYFPDDCSDTDATVLGSTALYADTDGDGFGADGTPTIACSASGLVANASDCDDSNATVNPGATELCDDGVDLNCDGVTACGTGRMVFETAADSTDRTSRDCVGAWDQTWTAATDLCPTCTFSFEVVNIPNGTPSTACGLDTMPTEWLLSFQPDPADDTQGLFWVYYAPTWYPTYLDVEQDADDGTLTWLHSDFRSWETLEADGTWYTSWFAGYAAWDVTP